MTLSLATGLLVRQNILFQNFSFFKTPKTGGATRSLNKLLHWLIINLLFVARLLRTHICPLYFLVICFSISYESWQFLTPYDAPFQI